jgi:hypothetical protein
MMAVVPNKLTCYDLRSVRFKYIVKCSMILEGFAIKKKIFTIAVYFKLGEIIGMYV